MAAASNTPLFAGLPDLPYVPNSEPTRIALDAFRTAIAVQAASAIGHGLSVEAVYAGVQIGAKGCDCNIAIPRFRLKEDAKAIAKRVEEQVCTRDSPETCAPG